VKTGLAPSVLVLGIVLLQLEPIPVLSEPTRPWPPLHPAKQGRGTTPRYTVLENESRLGVPMRF